MPFHLPAEFLLVVFKRKLVASRVRAEKVHHLFGSGAVHDARRLYIAAPADANKSLRLMRSQTLSRPPATRS